ncbi:MAG TPA: hypothetical protein VG736_04725 [Vicinamibacterales bacterium]|nr:hypothetical protein [Vicinamibacterales bacterium]
MTLLRRGTRARRAARLCVLALLAATPCGLLAQSPAIDAIYRVFLKTREALPSYGEPAVVGDRVVFNLIVGAPGNSQTMQLVNLPATRVDLPRTLRYQETKRAAFYGATLGEAEYAAMTAEVARALDQLSTVSDPQKRLALAEEARRRLIEWSDAHFRYRASDIRELAGMFDDVINQLRLAAGQPALTFDLVAGPPARERLLPAPTRRQSVTLALAAARTADIPEERIGILRLAEAPAKAESPQLGRTVTARLAAEVRAGSAYAALTAALLSRADAARRRGDVAAVQRLQQELARRDRSLGRQRPLEVKALATQLQETLQATKAFRRALDDYTRQRTSIRAYNTRIRPILSGIAASTPMLNAVRELHPATRRQLSSTELRLRSLQQRTQALRPPRSLAATHATLISAIRMAREALTRRQLDGTSRPLRQGPASSAAAGALLLVQQVRDDLARSLHPPTIQ